MRGMNGVGESLRESAVFNFAGAVTMVIDDSPFALELTAQAVLGFGIKVRHACSSAAEAIAVLRDHPVDLILVDCEMPGMSGYEFVRWLRRSGLEPNAFAPVIMTAAHVRRSKVSEARDCGANFLITKPFSAGVLLERIVWVARDARPFLEVGDYFGPDRRFRSEPWEGLERRSEEIRKAEFEAQRRASIEL
ncbi:CheY-like chemotaxis protein [Brevundimonas bullata]|jgi:CheY-like chemotaxis protein|uniref:CheY-like chemotaxis protein n=1 Tax=Brevundimonas bullata TaxID=13160 RepID=A0A7W7IS47_9CAUL|nr:response regulator [Brevundimonas bullata]MBB4799496.1 CheY-like chemotaxis protein [Brevundimonas bullata]MBB6384433.1 CheY-like chemotaxis protein [Brevundimonas bullata]